MIQMWNSTIRLKTLNPLRPSGSSLSQLLWAVFSSVSWGTSSNFRGTALIRTIGYDTGVISAVLVTLGDDLGHALSSKEQELVTSLTSGGALIGAIMAGLPADRFGRKFGIYIGCVLFLAGSVIQAAAFSVAQMAVGRFVVGLGVGSAAMIIVSCAKC
jgi:MFS family permease